ncbi:MAG: DUF2160 family membrane protein [Pseudomonadota bacterium]
MSWMGWIWQTAAFFAVIVALLAAMTLIAVLFPETPRRGVLMIETTRGDRLFISLLGSAFICLGFLAGGAVTLWWALAVCAVYAALVFIFV